MGGSEHRGSLCITLGTSHCFRVATGFVSAMTPVTQTSLSSHKDVAHQDKEFRPKDKALTVLNHGNLSKFWRTI